jgi:heme exporter protein D
LKNLESYLAMGGHGAFIWSAYAVAAVVLIGLLLVSWRAARVREAELATLQAAPGMRRRRGGGAEGGGA